MADEAQEEVPVDGEPQSPPISSRFLFVDIAAQRAKQLRKGALSRLNDEQPRPHKLERLAMEEVRRGLIEYSIPDWKHQA